MRNHFPRVTLIVVLIAVTTLVVAFAVGLAPKRATATSPDNSSWTVYHGNSLGSAVSTVLRFVTTSKRAWTSPELTGEIYGEPLVFGNDVYVATENDNVDALSAARGTVVWRRHIATAVPSSDLPCGNISPSVGITGTPVIDPSRREIFVVADEFVNGRPEHVLVGLNTTTGAAELHQRIDPTGSDLAALLQRTGLSLDAGRVVFGMGGNYGDCGTYRGRVESVSERGSASVGDGPPIVAAGLVWTVGKDGAVRSRGRYGHCPPTGLRGCGRQRLHDAQRG